MKMIYMSILITALMVAFVFLIGYMYNPEEVE